MSKTSASFRARLMGGAAAAVLMISAGSAAAQEVAKFDIAPQPLADALKQFGYQSGHGVLASPALADAKVSRGVAGEQDVEIALNQLLDGSGLTWKRNGDTFLIVSASDPQSGSAAGDGADQGTVQALIVTAQKREENIQDVPIAMSAFTQEDLTKSQVAGGPDLMTQVPNFTFTKTNFSGYSIQIRGIGTQAISATVDPAVAVAFNNTPFIRNRFFEQEFYDLQRIEVLRGPQGTLYGRNATAGVVNILSAKPNLHEFEAKLSGDVANYQSTRLEGMVNLPIVDDKVAFRLAGAWTKRNGYDTNQITGNPIDGRDLWSARASLRFEPTDWFKANLVYEHFEENDDRLRSGKQLCHRHNAPGVDTITGDGGGGQAESFLSTGCQPASLYSPASFEAPNGFALPYFDPFIQLGFPGYYSDVYSSTTQSRDLRVIQSTVDPKYRAKSDLGELQLSVDLSEHLVLTSETGYNSDFIFSSEDYNRFNTRPGVFFDSYNVDGIVRNTLTNGVFCDPQVGCANRLVAVDLSTARSRQFSQEFRVSSSFDGPLNFSVGVNFLRYDTEDKYYVFVNSLTLMSALAGQYPSDVNGNYVPPYVSGVSDNSQCMRNGLVQGDPRQTYVFYGCVYMDPNPIGSLNDLGHNYFLSKNPYKLISYATFGEAYYNITPSLKLTAGLRLSVDKKEAPRIPSWLLVAGQHRPTGTVGYPVMEVVRQEWREPTGRLALDWKPALSFTDETLLYASYARGYKAGGANPPPPVIATYLTEVGGEQNSGGVSVQDSIIAPKTFKPEFVNAFEVGAKNTLDGGKLTLNGDAFYYDYTGYQISQIVNRSAINYNFDARVWGLELEADWRPVENLRLGLKAGYEKTRVANGMKAIDIMDRTGGHSDWTVVRPFPTIPSNCILPTYVINYPGQVDLQHITNGSKGPCAEAYLFNRDPVTGLPYVANPPASTLPSAAWAGYRGFDPSTAPNHGEGFFTDLSGHELPNAPHYTLTATADYTIPFAGDWLATLHTDFYYQSEAWTRIFNMPGYDKLKAYTNVNVAAIFANEDAGWQVMAYVKNVLNKDNITGAFLNSDDTGLTTNVFLNEPRLYGIRVTKEWNGSPGWFTGDGHRPAGQPYPLTVEVGAGIDRFHAPTTPLGSDFLGVFPAEFNPLEPQNQKLDWGDGREVKVTYRPQGSWFLSAGVRFGNTNHTARQVGQKDLPPVCAVAGSNFEGLCVSDPRDFVFTLGESIRQTLIEREDFTTADFMVGKDVGFGGVTTTSSVSLGLGYARLNSVRDLDASGIPGWQYAPVLPVAHPVQWNNDRAVIGADRHFEGAGPVIAWDAAKRIMGDDAGHLDLAWTAEGGVLFGRQKADIRGQTTDQYFNEKYFGTQFPQAVPPTITTTPVNIHRSKSATVPTLDLSAGLSWEVQRVKVGAGYRWERYFNAIDGGYAEHKSEDRTIDGPYFKVSVGFGG